MLSRLQTLWDFARGRSLPSDAIVSSAPSAIDAQKPACHAQKPEILSRLTSLGMTQTQFADIVGVTPRTVRNWANGRTRMSEAAMLVLEMLEDRPEVRQDLCARVRLPCAPRGRPFAKGNSYRFGDRRRRKLIAEAQHARVAAA